MMRSLFSAVSGLKSNQTAMDIIGNNIANVNTIAYKTSRTVFQDIFSQTVATATAPTADTGGRNAKQVGLGTNISTIGMTMTEGSTQSTSNPLDFAINGEGFFVVDNGSGSYVYTRNGALQLDKEGYLVTANGDYVMVIPAETDDTTGIVSGISNGDALYDPGDPTADPPVPETPLFGKAQLQGDVTVTTWEDDDSDPATPDVAVTTPVLVDVDGDGTAETQENYTDYAIDEYGVISAKSITGDKVVIGRVVLASFNNTSGLEKVGSSYYMESANSGAAEMNFVGDRCGSLKSGSLEMSNVDLSTELTNMIITQRGFQANSRVITTTDTMLEELINLKR
jgi:flagellar hook protein FlgE